jgi:hypothetical protein
MHCNRPESNAPERWTPRSPFLCSLQCERMERYSLHQACSHYGIPGAGAAYSQSYQVCRQNMMHWRPRRLASCWCRSTASGRSIPGHTFITAARHIVGIDRPTLRHFCQTPINLEYPQLGDDGKKARKVQTNLAGDLKAVEEPGSSVIWDGAGRSVEGGSSIRRRRRVASGIDDRGGVAVGKIADRRRYVFNYTTRNFTMQNNGIVCRTPRFSK